MLVTKPMIKKIRTLKTVDVLCNICGESLHKSCDYEGLYETEIFGGFDSRYIGDYNSVSFAICEKCLFEKVFTLFSIPVTSSKDFDDFVNAFCKDDFDKVDKFFDKYAFDDRDFCLSNDRSKILIKLRSMTIKDIEEIENFNGQLEHNNLFCLTYETEE